MVDDVVDRPARSRFELAVDGKVAIAVYARAGDVLTFTHTEVPPELEGRGIGGRLVAGALDRVRAGGLKIVPRCPFVAHFIETHPQFADLVHR